MTIAVLCKWCPDPADLEVRSDGSLSLERAKWTISEYDQVAIEVAVSLGAGATDVVALASGPTRIDTSLARKAILSRGPDTLYLIADDRLDEADAGQTAAALTAAVTKIGGIELIVCGAGSADLYAQQVGIQIGERLGWITLNEIASITTDPRSYRAERRLDDHVDVIEVPLPAAIAVTADAAIPRVPGMRDILAAGKKPTTRWSLDDLGPAATVSRSARIVSTAARRGAHRQQVTFDGSPAEAADLLVGALQREGVV